MKKQVIMKAAGRVAVKINREPTQEELERQDLLARLEALEAEARRKNPQFRVPDPPQGLQRRQE
ncbi:MAG: hypothetical protein HPY55_06515 [Firmicutes bacterium]|nr:hypothetical protein [Bacillota bacterium]